MTRSLLKRCGEALYGPRWQTDIARDLGVADRTVRRWVDGSSDVPAGAYVDLHRLLVGRSLTIGELLEKIEDSDLLFSPPAATPDRT